MSNLDSMLEQNKKFAAQQVAAGTLMPSLPEITPHIKATIIGCADMRVDPADILGTKPGEALVIRNIGGRVTPVLLQELALLGRIGQVMHQVPGGGGEFHLIVLHHTDCGITRLAGDPTMLAKYFSDPGRGACREGRHRSARIGRRRCSCTEEHACVAGRMDCVGVGVRRSDRVGRGGRATGAVAGRQLSSSDARRPSLVDGSTALFRKTGGDLETSAL